MDWINIKNSQPRDLDRVWCMGGDGAAIVGIAFLYKRTWFFKPDNSTVSDIIPLEKWATYDVIY